MKFRSIIPLSLTFAALLAGVFSILMSAAGEYVQAAQLIMLSMILDGLDGTAARLLKGTSEIGAELDTFVDFISFGVAPAVLAFEAVLKNFGFWGLVMTSAIVLSGAYRLSRFRVVDPYRGQRGFLGLPITVNGGWIALFIFVTEAGSLDAEWFTLHTGPLAAFVWASSMMFTVLQVSHVRYSKPTKDPIFIAACAAMVVLLFLKVQVALASALTMCSYGFIYGFISPFFRRRHVLVVADEEDEEEPISLHR